MIQETARHETRHNCVLTLVPRSIMPTADSGICLMRQRQYPSFRYAHSRQAGVVQPAITPVASSIPFSGLQIELGQDSLEVLRLHAVTERHAAAILALRGSSPERKFLPKIGFCTQTV
jgi:hypothetical protein